MDDCTVLLGAVVFLRRAERARAEIAEIAYRGESEGAWRRLRVADARSARAERNYQCVLRAYGLERLPPDLEARAREISP